MDGSSVYEHFQTGGRAVAVEYLITLTVAVINLHSVIFKAFRTIVLDRYGFSDPGSGSALHPGRPQIRVCDIFRIITAVVNL